jgi:putative MFS transporter
MSGEIAAPVTQGASAAEIAVGKTLDELRSARLRFVPPLLLGLIMAFDSWDSIAIAYVMPSLVELWGLNPIAMGSLMSAGYAGQFVGAVLLGILAERFGRMPIFLWGMLLMSVLAIACAITPNYHTLFATRFVQGIMIGGALPVSITYINELAPTKIRGFYFGVFQLLSMSGYAMASQSSRWIIPELGWRWLFGLGATPVILLPLVMLLLPESPRWLARIGRIAAADRALVKLGAAPGSVIGAEGSVAVPAPAMAVEKTKVTELFTAQFRRRTIILISLWFFTAFTNFGLTAWLPSIYRTVFKFPTQEALGYAAIGSTVFLFLAPASAYVMDRIGRRPLGLGGVAIATIALIILYFYVPVGSVPDNKGLLIFLIVCAHMGTSICVLVLWPYTAENYPTKVRALGLGAASSTARGASMLTPLAVGGILENGGSINMVFAFFAACTIVPTVLWIVATRETARKSLDTL